jgi:peptide/nickel transport system permease protein
MADDRSSSRGRALARIAGSTLAGIWFALTLTFLLFHVGGAARFPVERLTDAAQAQIREQFGQDRSVPERYLSFMADAVRGDLGESIAYERPVVDVVRLGVERSLGLMASAVFVAFLVARVLAVAAVRTPNGRFDRIAMAVSATLASIPFHYVFIALLIVGVFTFELVPLPVAFRSDPTATGWAAAWDVIRHSVLLGLAIAVSLVGRFTLVMRARVLDRLEWTSESPRSRRARRRAFRETLGGSIRAVAGRVGFIISALVVVESIAGWPGAAGPLKNSIFQADYPVVQGVFLILTVFAVTLASAVRRRWPVESPPETLTSPIRNRAVRAGLLLTGVWIAFALLAPVILPSEQRTYAWGAQHGAPMSAPPFSTCDGAFPPCPAGERHFWLLGTNSQGVSNLEIAWEDRSRLGFVAWATAFGVVVGVVIGMLAGASPRVLGSMFGWLVDAVAAVPFMLALLALTMVPRGHDAPKVALALIGAGLVARPVARAWRSSAGRRFRALGAGAASLASFAFFAAALLPFSWIFEGNEIGLGWFRLALHTVNAAIPVLGLRLVAHGLSARRRSLFRAVLS